MRKASIPRREIQVLKRLREARERLGISQPAFAHQVGITRGRLANYEYLKTPLPCDLALKICHQFIIGERWLATGQGSMRQFMDLSIFVDNPALYRMSFGEAYDKSLAAPAEKQAAQLDFGGGEGAFILSRPTVGTVNEEQFYRNYLNMLLDNWTELLKKNGRQGDVGQLLEELTSVGFNFFHDLLNRK